MPEDNQNAQQDHGEVIGYEARWDYEERVPVDSIDPEEDTVVNNG